MNKLLPFLKLIVENFNPMFIGLFVLLELVTPEMIRILFILITFTFLSHLNITGFYKCISRTFKEKRTRVNQNQVEGHLSNPAGG